MLIGGRSQKGLQFANKTIEQNWDDRKSLLQNYETLGLVANVNAGIWALSLLAGLLLNSIALCSRACCFRMHVYSMWVVRICVLLVRDGIDELTSCVSSLCLC